MKCEGCEHACGVCDKGEYKTATVSDSPGSTGYVDKLLNGLHKRIQEAGEKGRGCRITAEEARYLKYYNLPNTTEHISVRCV